MPQRPVFINGKNYDQQNIEFVIFGLPLIGITDIEYTRKRVKKLNYGIGSEPISYGLGNYDYMGSISVYKDELKALLATAPNRSILDIPPFSAVVVYEGDGVPTTTDRLKNVMFTEDPFNVKQNDTAIIVKIPFIFAGLYQ